MGTRMAMNRSTVTVIEAQTSKSHSSSVARLMVMTRQKRDKISSLLSTSGMYGFIIKAKSREARSTQVPQKACMERGNGASWS